MKQKVYWIDIDAKDTVLIKEHEATDEEIREGFSYGENYVPQYLLCFSREDAQNRLELTREEFGLTKAANHTD